MARPELGRLLRGAHKRATEELLGLLDGAPWVEDLRGKVLTTRLEASRVRKASMSGEGPDTTVRVGLFEAAIARGWPARSGSSSSGTAISWPTSPTTRRARRSSTAPSRSRIPGASRRSRGRALCPAHAGVASCAAAPTYLGVVARALALRLAPATPLRP
mgnify:CR=1 FL=1